MERVANPMSGRVDVDEPVVVTRSMVVWTYVWLSWMPLLALLTVAWDMQLPIFVLSLVVIPNFVAVAGMHGSWTRTRPLGRVIGIGLGLLALTGLALGIAIATDQPLIAVIPAVAILGALAGAAIMDPRLRRP